MGHPRTGHERPYSDGHHAVSPPARSRHGPETSFVLALNFLSVRFNEPQWAPTPGQCLVLDDGDVCLGGAVIDTPLECRDGQIAELEHAG